MILPRLSVPCDQERARSVGKAMPREDPWMRPPKPKFRHPPEVYQAIITEHGSNEVRMAE